MIYEMKHKKGGTGRLPLFAVYAIAIIRSLR